MFAFEEVPFLFKKEAFEKFISLSRHFSVFHHNLFKLMYMSGLMLYYNDLMIAARSFKYPQRWERILDTVLQVGVQYI